MYFIPYKMFDIKTSGMFPITDKLIPDIYILYKSMIKFVF